jgi:hypothetical protein
MNANEFALFLTDVKKILSELSEITTICWNHRTTSEGDVRRSLDISTFNFQA